MTVFTLTSIYFNINRVDESLRRLFTCGQVI